MNQEQKAATIEEIGNELDAATAIFAVDYRGISVPQAAELRVKLGEADASFNVVKNRLAKRATEKAGASSLDEHLVGPTALTYVKGDPVLAAKAIADFTKANQILVYKGGIMEGAPLDAEQFSAIAQLPGVDVLRGQLVGIAASPLTGIVRTLNQLISGLASQLGQVAEQGLLSGEAPVAEEPAEEAEIAEAQGTEEAGEQVAAEVEASGDDEQDAPDAGDPKGPDEPAVDAEPPAEDPEKAGDDSTSETEDKSETPEETADGADESAGDDKED